MQFISGRTRERTRPSDARAKVHSTAMGRGELAPLTTKGTGTTAHAQRRGGPTHSASTACRRCKTVYTTRAPRHASNATLRRGGGALSGAHATREAENALGY